jgi:hypothetical protein
MKPSPTIIYNKIKETPKKLKNKKNIENTKILKIIPNTEIKK